MLQEGSSHVGMTERQKTGTMAGSLVLFDCGKTSQYWQHLAVVALQQGW